MLKKLMTSVVFLGLAAGAADAVTVYSDSFDANPRRNGTAPIGWTITSGSVNLVRRFPGQGVQVDMDGRTASPARIQTNQIFNFVSGNKYTISFSYGKSVTTTQEVNFGAGSFTQNLSVTGAATPNMLQHAYAFVVTSAFSSRLSFWSNFGNRSGVFVDNVQISVTPVPVPAALPLLLTGIGGIGALSRRRRRA
jgi:hypothetical protein